VEILPNVSGPVMVLAALDLAAKVLLLAALSFLGLGAQAPTAEWGAMVASGAEQFQFWWLATFAGLAIFSVVLGFNLIGDALRDAIDPRTRLSN
jgi:peptide/nickel transport system permease protein